MVMSAQYSGLALMMVAALALGGCAGAVVGAAATGGVAAAQERTVGQAIDDQVIQTEINHLLLQRSESLFTNVDTEVVEGRVLMTGNVNSPDERIDATRFAWQVDGVKEVLNELLVNDKSSIADYAKDSSITLQLRTRMLGDSKILDINYSVETVKGVVYLFGIAQDDAELKRVTAHARTIKGVKEVVSHVVLKDHPSRQS